VKPRNGSPDVEFFGSPLNSDALRILVSLTPAEVRQLARMVEHEYLPCAGYRDSLGAIRKIQQAAEVA